MKQRSILISVFVVIGSFLFAAFGDAVVNPVFRYVLLHDLRVELPRIEPDVEQVCRDTMLRSGPDRTWVSSSSLKAAGVEAWLVTLGELRGHGLQLVRVAGFIHAEFEWVALYTSRAAMDDYRSAPWVNLQRLAVGEDLRTLREAVSDRCVVVEGTYERGQLGHMGMFNGSIDAVKLEVWSTPHRPVPPPSPPPPPPPPPSPTARP